MVGSGGEAVSVDGVHVEALGGPLSDDEAVTVGGEGHLGWLCAGCAEGPGGVGDRLEVAVACREPGDVAGIAGVEDVHQVAVHGDAGRHGPAGLDDVDQFEAVAADAERRDAGAAWVDGVQVTAGVVERDGPL